MKVDPIVSAYAESLFRLASAEEMADRVEEEERTGTGISRSGGECSTYRVWYCPNTDCVLYKTDLYREPIADRTDRSAG